MRNFSTPPQAGIPFGAPPFSRFVQLVVEYVPLVWDVTTAGPPPVSRAHAHEYTEAPAHSTMLPLESHAHANGIHDKRNTWNGPIRPCIQ
jgi:hypothetical protein